MEFAESVISAMALMLRMLKIVVSAKFTEKNLDVMQISARLEPSLITPKIELDPNLSLAPCLG